MSAEALWQAEVRRVWEEFRELWTCFTKLDVDMYKGNGPQNPPITQRMASAEGRLDRIEGRQKENRGYLLAILVAVIGDILKDIGMPILRHIFQ